MPVHGAEVGDGGHHRAVVAVDHHGGQEAAQHGPGGLVEAAHDPEVEERDLAVGGDEQVAGVHVAVEQAVHERALDPRPGADAHELGEVVALGAQRVAVVDRHGPRRRS